MSTPRFLPEDPAFGCLRMGDFEGFRRATAERKTVDFSGADLRGTDFRKVNLACLVLRDAYLRDADLRGCDLRHLDLEGVSLQNAKISGTYFPANLTADEIRFSVTHGTRLRTMPSCE